MRVTTETVKELKDSRSVWPDWMQSRVTGLSDDDEVVVTRRHTFAGSFVVAVDKE